MNITVKRLHELKGRQLGDFGALMLAEIVPDRTDVGTTWVCQRLQRGGFWGPESIKRMVANDGNESDGAMMWVALDGKRPVGLCFIAREAKNRMINLYFAATSYHKDDQWAIADALALDGLRDILPFTDPDALLYGYWLRDGWAGEYARRCGFRSRPFGKPLTLEANPMMLWEIGVEELLDKIQGLQRDNS